MILVTGGTGLVGSYILYYLLKSGHKVRATYRNPGKLKNTEFIFRHLYELDDVKPGGSWNELFGKIAWVECDVRDTDGLNEAMQGVAHIFHTAAIVSFNRRDARLLMDINVQGTANIVNLSIENNVQKLICISSTAALARRQGAIIDEGFHEEMSFKSTYSRSKYQAEMEVWRGIGEGLNAVILNPGVILGWGDFTSGSIALIKKIAEGFRYYTEGVNGFVDARDVAMAAIQLGERPDAVNNRYIAVAESISYRELFNMIAAEAGQKPPSAKAGKTLGKIIAAASELSSFFTGKAPFLTLELAEKSQGKYNYDSSKLCNILSYNFITVKQSVRDAVHIYRKAQ